MHTVSFHTVSAFAADHIRVRERAVTELWRQVAQEDCGCLNVYTPAHGNVLA